MAGTVTFAAGGTSVVVGCPKYAYTSELHLALKVIPTTTGYRLYDRGSSYDYRVCKGAAWQFTAAQATSLSTLFRSVDLARGETVTMTLSSGSGFYPFGPDKGDSGIFTVKLLERKQSGAMFQPFRYFEQSIDLVMVTAPVYSLPTQIDQGSLEIGSVDGLLYPQAGIDPEPSYGFTEDLLETGSTAVVDCGSGCDIWTASWEQDCNQSKAAALMSFLAGTSGRASDITITAPAYTYLFGIDQGDVGVYTCKLINPIISCSHRRFDNFGIDLSFWMSSKA